MSNVSFQYFLWFCRALISYIFFFYLSLSQLDDVSMFHLSFPTKNFDDDCNSTLAGHDHILHQHDFSSHQNRHHLKDAVRHFLTKTLRRFCIAVIIFFVYILGLHCSLSPISRILSPAALYLEGVVTSSHHSLSRRHNCFHT